MYARTSFRGAKTCRIGKKGVFLVIETNFGKDMTNKLRKMHAKCAFRVFFLYLKNMCLKCVLKVHLRGWYPAWNTSAPQALNSPSHPLKINGTLYGLYGEPPNWACMVSPLWGPHFEKSGTLMKRSENVTQRICRDVKHSLRPCLHWVLTWISMVLRKNIKHSIIIPCLQGHLYYVYNTSHNLNLQSFLALEWMGRWAGLYPQ